MSNLRLMSLMAWIIASFFYSYQYILRVIPNILITDIISLFSIDSQIFGQFSGIYYIGYCLAHIPIGMMLDRHGVKIVMSSCLLLNAIGILLMLPTSSFLYPFIGRIFIGIGSSAAILSVFKTIRLIFAEEKFTRMLSISVMIGLIGAIYGGMPLEYMYSIMGYEKIIIFLASLGIILAITSYLIVPNDGKTKREEIQTSFLTDIKDVLSNGKVLLVCILAGTMIGPMEGFADVWGGVFFERVYGFDKSLAASLTSMIFIGMCFGAPVLNFISEKSKSQYGTIIFAALFMAISFILLSMYFLYFSTTFISSLLIIIGICCAYQIIAIYKASTYVREGIVGLTTAMANMIIMAFGYFFHSVIGVLVKSFGGIDSSFALIMGIGIIPIMLIISAIGFIFIAKHDLKARIKLQR